MLACTFGCGGSATTASQDGTGGQDGSRAVGDPCVPYNEHLPLFGGFRINDTSFEFGHPSCSGGLCLVNHFQGRVSCPEGQPAGAGTCAVPESGEPVTAEVCGQCSARPASSTVYCSCRCGPANGQPPVSSYCSCPAGFACVELQPYFEGLSNEHAGSYCMKAGTEYDNHQPDACGEVSGHLGQSCEGAAG